MTIDMPWNRDWHVQESMVVSPERWQEAEDAFVSIVHIPTVCTLADDL